MRGAGKTGQTPKDRWSFFRAAESGAHQSGLCSELFKLKMHETEKTNSGFQDESQAEIAEVQSS